MREAPSAGGTCRTGDPGPRAACAPTDHGEFPVAGAEVRGGGRGRPREVFNASLKHRGGVDPLRSDESGNGTVAIKATPPPHTHTHTRLGWSKSPAPNTHSPATPSPVTTGWTSPVSTKIPARPLLSSAPPGADNLVAQLDTERAALPVGPQVHVSTGAPGHPAPAHLPRGLASPLLSARSPRSPGSPRSRPGSPAAAGWWGRTPGTRSFRSVTGC